MLEFQTCQKNLQKSRNSVECTLTGQLECPRALSHSVNGQVENSDVVGNSDVQQLTALLG